VTRTPTEDTVYSDETASIERRVADLLSRMTLEEKAAQLGSINADQLLEDGSLDRERATCDGDASRRPSARIPTSSRRWRAPTSPACRATRRTRASRPR
jgi:hypothetical protein